MEQELAMPVLLLLGSLWEPGPNPTGELPLSISSVLLEMEQASETSDSPTRTLNYRVNYRIVMAD